MSALGMKIKSPLLFLNVPNPSISVMLSFLMPSLMISNIIDMNSSASVFVILYFLTNPSEIGEKLFIFRSSLLELFFYRGNRAKTKHTFWWHHHSLSCGWIDDDSFKMLFSFECAKAGHLQFVVIPEDIAYRIDSCPH